MSANKLLLKDRVLTSGQGSRRVVLDYESSLVYQYDEPSNVLAYYESGKGWIIRDKPYYSSGGWGSGSSGDADGHYLISNATDLLSSINARIYEVNSLVFLTSTETKDLQRAISEHNKLAIKQRAIAEKLGEKNVKVEELPKIDNYKLRPLDRYYKVKGSPKGIDAIKTALGFESALNVFLNKKGKPITIGGYTITSKEVKQDSTIVAFRDSADNIFMNSAVIRTSDFESKFLGKQSLIQKSLRKVSKYNIPFNVLASASLKLSETTVLEQGPESTHEIKGENGPETRHFTGALLLENAGRKFLMDIDRQEITFGIFNAFFVELDSSVSSIEQAYDSMKPLEVKQAEKEGLEVLRQGEWFFIPTDKTVKVSQDDVKEWDNSGKTGIVLRSNISHGKGRPNSLYKPVGFGTELDSLVCGTVKHSGREHKDLELGKKILENENKVEFKLWKVVGNTTVGNFTIKGDID